MIRIWARTPSSDKRWNYSYQQLSLIQTLFESLICGRYYARDWGYRHTKITAPASEEKETETCILKVRLKSGPEKCFNRQLNNVQWKHAHKRTSSAHGDKGRLHRVGNIFFPGSWRYSRSLPARKQDEEFPRNQERPFSLFNCFLEPKLSSMTSQAAIWGHWVQRTPGSSSVTTQQKETAESSGQELRSQTDGVHNLASGITSCVSLDNLLNLSGSWFPHLCYGNNNSTYS